MSAATGDEASHQVLPPSHKKPTDYVMAIIENIATKVFIDLGLDVSLISYDFRMSNYLDNDGTLAMTISLGNEV